MNIDLLPLDTLIVIECIAAMTVVGMLAAALPARRMINADPIGPLRQQ